MATLARSFPQENLVVIDKAEFKAIRAAIQNNCLLSFSKDAWMVGDRAGWYMKSVAGETGRYLLVEYYQEKETGGLEVAYKADKEMLATFRQQKH